MAVRRIQTNKEIYERIKEFFPKIEGKSTVTIDVIKELHQLTRDAGFSIPQSNCGGCDNQRMIKELTAYVYTYENQEQ